jgi:hypothetical protein
VRTSLITLAAGAVAAIGALYTARTFSLNRRGQVTERFTRAVDQLASRELSIRLGGVYALEQLAADSAREHGTILEILTAFVRGKGKGSATPAADVQAVVTVLARRRLAHERGRPPKLDLGDADLRSVRAEGLVLRGARLTRARLEDANLLGADLRDAGLVEAHLERATLRRADLRGAHLQRAWLAGANLADAKLADASLQGARYDSLTLWPDGFDAGAAGAESIP